MRSGISSATGLQNDQQPQHHDMSVRSGLSSAPQSPADNISLFPGDGWLTRSAAPTASGADLENPDPFVGLSASPGQGDLQRSALDDWLDQQPGLTLDCSKKELLGVDTTKSFEVSKEIFDFMEALGKNPTEKDRLKQLLNAHQPPENLQWIAAPELNPWCKANIHSKQVKDLDYSLFQIQQQAATMANCVLEVLDLKVAEATCPDDINAIAPLRDALVEYSALQRKVNGIRRDNLRGVMNPKYKGEIQRVGADIRHKSLWPEAELEEKAKEIAVTSKFLAERPKPAVGGFRGSGFASTSRGMKTRGGFSQRFAYSPYTPYNSYNSNHWKDRSQRDQHRERSDRDRPSSKNFRRPPRGGRK